VHAKSDAEVIAVRPGQLVDTSFFTSIGAVNPAITAMANALRVGEHIRGRSAP
jgi:hypothetical protein